jgi:tetratricopeptide (TPR) repeat protein
MPATATDPAFRILLVVSRPLDQPDLPHLGDQWALINGLQTAKASAYLKILRPPTIEGLRTEILAGYEVVHFDGHGGFGLCCPNCGMLHNKSKGKCDRCSASLEGQAEGGYLAFEREDGALDSLAAQDLADIIAYPGYSTKLALLSACKSAAGEEKGLLQALVDKGIPAVLGMKDNIPAKATQAFFAPFYAALGKGMPIFDAFKIALPALKRFDEASKVPQLEGEGKDAKLAEGKHAAGKVPYEPDSLHGLPEYEFIGDYIRGDPPRGRKGYLARLIKAFLEDKRLIVLIGPAGVGKTVIAAETAKRIAYRFPGGVFWRSAKDMERLGLDELLDAFADMFGDEFRKQTIEAKRDRVLSYLRDYTTSSLIVVDNAELIKDDRLLSFLKVIPQASAVLVTTREGLAYGGQQIRVDKMEEDESLRLFKSEPGERSDRWKKIKEGKEELSFEESKDLNEILRLLKGHPLGLKIAAGMLSGVSLHAILESLRKHPPEEVSGEFDFSYSLLSETEKDLLQRMIAFAGSYSYEAVQAICGSEGDQSTDCSETLGKLARKSFVESIDDRNPRYEFHPLMRQYVASKTDIEKIHMVQSDAAHFFLEYAKNSEADFKKLDLERENILACMDWAEEQMRSSKEAAQMVSEFMSALDEYLDVKGYWIESGLRLRHAIEAEKIIGDEKGISGWIHNLGILAQHTGNYDEARKLYQQSLEIEQKLGDQSGISKSLHQLGILAQKAGNYDEARKLYQQSLEIKQKLGDQSGISNSFGQLGILAEEAGNYDEARKLYQQSLEIKQKLGDQSGISKNLQGLGILAYRTGNYDEARKLYQQSLEIDQKLGGQSGISISLHQLGILAQDTGNYDEARKLYQQSLEIDQKLGDQSGISISLRQLGLLAQDTGNYDEARKLYQQSIEIDQKLGGQSGYASSLSQLALREEMMGNIPKAIELTQQAESIFAELGAPQHIEEARKQRERLEEEKNKSS